MTPTQARLAAFSPHNAPMLFSLNASMLYGGTALGAAVGGATSNSVGFGALAWVGAMFALAGGLTLLPGLADKATDLDRRGVPTP
jgi:DHA1 family inner membrane transport protein